MGRPKNANPKSAAQSQREYIQRKNDELTAEVCNAQEARRKHTSERRIWKQFSENEKERRRVFQSSSAKKIVILDKKARMTVFGKGRGDRRLVHLYSYRDIASLSHI